MKAPHLADQAFLDDVALARDTPDRLHIWWLGQSGFLVQWQGRHLLLDPYLSDSLSRKYAETDKPHTRMTARVIAPERLNFIDVVTSSHNHTDHLDAETLIPLMEANASLTFVVGEANRAVAAERLQRDPAWFTGIDDGTVVEAAGFTLRGVPAAHEALERDELGRCRYLGLIVRAGPWTLYHSGDTIHYPDMNSILRPWAIDVAMLPINGSAPERRVAGNLDGQQAARLSADVGAGLVIPCHYDMFEFNTAAPDEFIVTCESLGQPYVVLRNGERWSSSPIAEVVAPR